MFKTVTKKILVVLAVGALVVLWLALVRARVQLALVQARQQLAWEDAEVPAAPRMPRDAEVPAARAGAAEQELRVAQAQEALQAAPRKRVVVVLTSRASLP
jgi:hypothetical protein